MSSPSPVRRRHVALAAAASLAVLFALLTLLELALRATGLGPPPLFKLDAQLRDQAEVAVPDLDLIYRLKPGATLLGRYRINALGYRGPEVARQRTSAALRVVCTGDSSTFGLGVGEDEAWPFVLGRLLRAALDRNGNPKEVEIIDAGVPGYTTLQNRAQILRDLLPLRPDAIVWCPMGHNDAARVPPPDERERWAKRRGFGGWLRRLALVHRLAWLLESPPDPDAATVPRVSLAKLEENLQLAAAAARAASVPLVLVAPPHDVRARTERPDEVASEQRVVDVARSEGIALADPRVDIAALAGRDPFPDGVHPDPAAHERIARHAFAALVRAFPELLAPPFGAVPSPSGP